MKKGLYIITLALVMSTLSGCNSNDDNIPVSTEVNVIQDENKQIEDKTEDKELEEVQQEETTSSDDESNNESSDNEIVEIDYNEVKPNEIGSIMVVMYHGLMDNPPYHRKPEDFLKDLNYMYENKYRPISIEDYVNNNISVEPGYTPILLTFDDGLSSSFSLTKDEKGNLVPAEGTAVYMMEEFYKEHPDFGKAATFFINGDDAFSEGDGSYEERLQWLVSNGYSIGNHTANHLHLNKLNQETLQKEIAVVDQMIKAVIPDYEVNSLAYPFGQRPSDYIGLVEAGVFESHTYSNQIAFRVGYSAPYVSPNHIQYQPFNHPRVTASEGYDWDLWYSFNYYENNPEARYVSDGNPNTIAIPAKNETNLNPDSLGNKELVIY